MPIKPTTVESVPDVAGTEVKIGDRVAVAFRMGNTAEMRVGTVLGFLTQTSEWQSDITLMEIAWEGFRSTPQKPTRIEARLKRFAKIG